MVFTCARAEHTLRAHCHARLRRFLLDLEMCVRVEHAWQPAQRPASWGTNALVEGSYVAASDLYQLGRMLQDHSSHVATPQGCEFLSLLASPAQALQAGAVTAESLLQHAWLRCRGASCMEAGAHPGETGS